MTQNDIAYYNAVNEKRDATRRRKETKRHNKVSEKLSAQANAVNQLAAEARYLSALASQTSASAAQANAAAAAKQAEIRQQEYQLDWAKEYGWPYGTSQAHMDNYQNYSYYDVDKGTYVSAWNAKKNSQAGDIIVTVPNTTVPVSYMKSWFGISQTEQDIKTGGKQEESLEVRKYGDATNAASKLVQTADTIISWFK